MCKLSDDKYKQIKPIIQKYFVRFQAIKLQSLIKIYNVGDKLPNWHRRRQKVSITVTLNQEIV